MTPLGRIPCAIVQDVFLYWCYRVVVVPRKDEPLDIDCMDHNFIRLAVFALPNNIDFRLYWAIWNGSNRFDALGSKWASMTDCTGLNQESALGTRNTRELWLLDQGQGVLPRPRVLVKSLNPLPRVWLEYAWILTTRPQAQAWKEASKPALHAFRAVRRGKLFGQEGKKFFWIYISKRRYQ